MTGCATFPAAISSHHWNHVCFSFLHHFHVEFFLGSAAGKTHREMMPSHQLSHYKDPFFPLCRYTNSCQASAGKGNKKQKAHYQFHLFPQLYPHLNYGCLTYCMEREIKQTDEGTSQGDMWVSVESQAG